MGHTKETCYKIVGYPPNYFKNRSNSSVNNVDGSSEQNPTHNSTLTIAQCQQLIQYLTTQLTTTPSIPSTDDIATNVIGNILNSILPINSYQWIIDYGATSHICCYKSLYDSYVPMNNSHVLLPNSFKVKVEGIGSIKLTQDIFLHNVLYIPSFRFNLLSLLTLIQQNQFYFIMQPNFIILQDLKSQKTIGTAKSRHDLLVFDFYKHSLPSVNHYKKTCKYRHLFL